MKKLFLITAFIAASLGGRSQITFYNSFPYNQLYHVHFEHAGNKLAYLDYSNYQILLFNYNGALYKTINIVPPSYPTNGYFIKYLSEDLFDTDPSNMEYIQTYSSGGPSVTHIRIYDENGNLLFSRDSMSLSTLSSLTSAAFDDPIFQRGNSTYLRLTSYNNPGPNRSEFYKLPGQLFNGMAPQQAIRSADGSENVFESNDQPFAFPNPSSSACKIYYQLPQGVSQCNLILYDMSGNAVQQFTVSDVFTYITVSTADLPQGTYTYAIKTSNELIKGKEVVVVH